MEQLDDMALVTRVTVLADNRAFDRLVRKYQSQVRLFFLHQTVGDAQLSDDMAQDTFVKAYNNISKFRGLSSFSTWLYRIAYNVFCDYTRSHRATLDIDTATVAMSRKLTASVDCGTKMDVYGALSRLKPDERTCITLQLIEGLPIDRIATIMNMPSGTVKSHLSRGKEKLTTFLKSNGYDRR